MDRRLVVLATGMFAIGTDSFVIAGILPEVSESLGVSIAVAGQMVTVYALSFALLSPVIAAAAAHWPRKRLLLAGMAVFVLGNLITAIAPSIGWVLASRFIAGLGAAMFSPTATATGASLVAPERRASALAIVIAGLSAATALGSPIGTFIGGLGDWRTTMWFVTAVGLIAGAGVYMFLPTIPPLPAVSLRERLVPLRDSRIALTLMTTLVAYSGFFAVYTYVGVTFDRATGGQPDVLAALLLLWGIAATAGNFAAGYITDRFGSRLAINGSLAAAAINFALLPWTTAHLWSSALALVVWGVCGWGLLVPQQHRLISLAPGSASLLLGLNSAALYVGVSASGVIGAAGITLLDRYQLGLIGAAFIALALVIAQITYRQISRVAANDIRLAEPVAN
ncbi:MFS transporter [Sinorhizobium sp. 8-89]|uniref:MFS transporter n=1 Tax=Sinorhizobium sp. 7-81 TaxID=3049087 RepID=UPI0024C20DF2|nr:MFS transporter [Sinorhizobium sp. 7-81]MDK1388530.1 MFS transporter [Sinorhizobium sp. 7-81]